jgi:hypothetical protein
MWCVSEDKIRNHEITRDGHEKKFLICDAEKFVFYFERFAPFKVLRSLEFYLLCKH